MAQEKDYSGEPQNKVKDEYLNLVFENVRLEIQDGIVKLWIAGEKVYNGAQPPVPPIKP